MKNGAKNNSSQPQGATKGPGEYTDNLKDINYRIRRRLRGMSPPPPKKVNGRYKPIFIPRLETIPEEARDNFYTFLTLTA